MLCTRLGISYCESHDQIFIESRLKAIDCCENTPKYLRNTKGLFLIFGEGSKLTEGGYTDADGRMSTSVCILELC